MSSFIYMLQSEFALLFIASERKSFSFVIVNVELFIKLPGILSMVDVSNVSKHFHIKLLIEFFSIEANIRRQRTVRLVIINISDAIKLS